MKKHNLISIAFVFASFTILFSTNAYALPMFNINFDNFSYSKLLPVIFGVTLLVEIIIIMLFSKIRRIVNVSFAVFLANAASFFVIRIFLGVMRNKVFYSGMLINGTSITDWLMLGLCFAVTLGAELPIIWFSLRPFTPQKNRLMWCAVAANAVSFAVITVFEIYLKNSLIK